MEIFCPRKSASECVYPNFYDLLPNICEKKVKRHEQQPIKKWFIPWLKISIFLKRSELNFFQQNWRPKTNILMIVGANVCAVLLRPFWTTENEYETLHLVT